MPFSGSCTSILSIVCSFRAQPLILVVVCSDLWQKGKIWPFGPSKEQLRSAMLITEPPLRLGNASWPFGEVSPLFLNPVLLSYASKSLISKAHRNKGLAGNGCLFAFLPGRAGCKEMQLFLRAPGSKEGPQAENQIDKSRQYFFGLFSHYLVYDTSEGLLHCDF